MDSHQRGYLFGALADGAKLFRYRTGVRSLLGFPKGEDGNLVLSPVLPPVGFRYSTHPVMFESFQTRYSPDMIASRAFDGGQVAETGDPQFKSLEVVENRETTENRNLEPLSVLDKDLETSKSMTFFEKSKIEIPGTSESRTNFADIFHHGMGEMRSFEHEGQHQYSEEELMAPRQEITDSNSEVGAGAAGKKYGGEAGLREKVSDKAERDTAFPLQKQTLKEGAMPGQVGASPGEAVTGNTSIPSSRQPHLPCAQEMEDEMIPIASPQSAIRRSKPGVKISLRGDTVAFKKHDYSLEGLSLLDTSEKTSKSVAFPARGAVGVERTNQDVSERIEQLRCSMQALTLKGQLRQTITERETGSHKSEQTPPPPPQPLVLVRQTVTQNRMPLAFWERSHLGRFRLRSLR